MEKLVVGAQKLGYELTPRQLEQFTIYYQELVDWNRRINLTAITDDEEVQVKHFLDSLSVTLALDPPEQTGLRVIDVGTGAGFPGLPLKILLPEIRLTLLEATAKKADFLRHVTEKLGISDVEIVVGRAEEVAHQDAYREKFDLTLSRAVAVLPTLVELCLPFCAIGGCFIAHKSGDAMGEAAQAAKAIRVMGGGLREVKRVNLNELPGERYLVVIDKLQPIPPLYPRRPGLPAKRPII